MPNFKGNIFTFVELSDLIKEALLFSKKKNIKTLLFSPSCSSFDQYKDFEERGTIFKKLIYKVLLK